MSVSFICDNVEAIIKVSLISYIKNVELRSSLFDSSNKSSAISSAYTKFFVIYTILLAALE